jgi:chemotaxis protein CheD
MCSEKDRLMGSLKRAANSTIPIGGLAVASSGEQLRTLLGSCIGLALYDRRRKVGGLSHIVLPQARGKTDRPGKFADTAIPALIEQLQALAGGELALAAKMAGGASMFTNNVAANIGQQNMEACQRLLRALGIPLVARDCGGEQGRRMTLNTANGQVLIEIAGRDPIEL